VTISDYVFGRIAIDGRTFTSDVIVFPERIQASWWRRQGHRLQVEDLQEVLAAEPRVVVVGTGYYGRMQVYEETRRSLESLGIELRVAPTPAAIELFNPMQESAAVVAALHLTC
jgi:hypothetical protein